MKILESQSPYIFSEKEILEIERKFRYITLEIVDSYGYYEIVGTSEEILLTTYIDRVEKLNHYFLRERNLFCKLITHGQAVYFVFYKNV